MAPDTSLARALCTAKSVGTRKQRTGNEGLSAELCFVISFFLLATAVVDFAAGVVAVRAAFQHFTAVKLNGSGLGKESKGQRLSTHGENVEITFASQKG